MLIYFLSWGKTEGIWGKSKKRRIRKEKHPKSENNYLFLCFKSVFEKI
jgi:hypothetical protein